MTMSWGLASQNIAWAQEGGVTNIPSVTGLRPRSEIPERHRWNLTDIFKSDSDFEASFKTADGLIAKLPKLRGTLGHSTESLLTALKLRDDLAAEIDRLIVYAGLSYHEDMSVNVAQGRADRAESLATRAAEAASWLVPEILSLPAGKVHAWLESNKELAVYRHYLEDLERQRAHVLSPREEELLAMAGDIASGPGNIYSRFTNTNLDFPTIKNDKGNDVKLSVGQYSAMIYSRDRRVRKDAWTGLHETYQAKANTLSALLSTHVKQHMFYAKARGFKTCREAALFNPNIPVAVYDNLVATIHRHLPKLHRYVALRKKLMGLSEVHQYDLYVPIVEAPEETLKYDDAVETILKALAPLGPDYIATLRKSFESRWIDVYESPNKRSGAYCWGSYLTHPYLLLNFHGTTNDRSTIAHELGHAMHSWYTVKNQPFIYGDYATFCAEVASTVNEVILAHYLLDHAKTDIERLLILQQQIDEIRTTVFRQTMFAEFEMRFHEMAERGEPLTGEVLSKEYQDMVRKYYGPHAAYDDCGAAEGLRIPHFYSNFYVYTYATSHCAATNIGRRILARDPTAVDGLMKFLSSGSSRYPLETLRLAGVDMTTPRPIEDTMQLFDELLTEFESLFQKQSNRAAQ
ncbi:MAG TPA: oligoendopeptidase F [Phycisphaerae bacterium]|nr:oligoendopeptidase F [Phycisphaerae bacterium]